MKRLQIMIEQELYDELGRQAAKEGVSKAALIRRYVGERLRAGSLAADDPLWDIAGMVEGGRDDALRVNAVVYGDLGRS